MGRAWGGQGQKLNLGKVGIECVRGGREVLAPLGAPWHSGIPIYQQEGGGKKWGWSSNECRSIEVVMKHRVAGDGSVLGMFQRNHEL